MVVLSFADEPREQNLWPGVAEIAGQLYDHRLEIAVALIGAEVALRTLAWLARRMRPLDQAKLKSLLEAVVAQQFAQQDRAQHFYRATLFQLRSAWFVGSWLGIVARSGELYPQRTAIFSVSAATQKYCTGISGECWRRGGQTIILTLPDIRANPDWTKENDYKTQGVLDDREFKALNVKAVVFLATGIRVGGRVWGVLVLDSTDPKQEPGERQRAQRQDTLQIVAIALEQLVS